MLCWQPVTLDCTGGVESAVIYAHEVALRPPQGFISCVWDGVPTTCPLPAAPPVFVSTPDFDDGCAATPEPLVGEVVLLHTTAIDAAGNADCGG